MVLPLPAEAPLASVCDVTVHENVVPVTVLDRAILVVAPEQIVGEEGVAIATGVGFTLMVTVVGLPLQPLALGVIV